MVTILAPRFLDYSEEVNNADAIILFVGPDRDAREDEALRLFTDGFSGKLRYLHPHNELFSEFNYGR